MTLLGKGIFRPWDLSGQESSLGKPCKSEDEEEKSPAILEEKREEDADAGKSEKSGRPSVPNLSLYPRNNGGYQHLDLNPGPGSYFFPTSPGTAPSTPGTSVSFSASATLNELASLTRGELTAMGLLPPEPPAGMKVKRQRPKRFHCPHCNVAFSNNGQLRGHIRIHTGERPFACDHDGCGKSFTRNEELTRHRRIHTGLRPYPCSHCGKKFGRKDHLKKHTRTHQRPVYPAAAVGLGHPFHAYGHSSLLPGAAMAADAFAAAFPHPSPWMLSIAPPLSHFPFS